MNSLPREAKVVVIGGGIAGCSTAYHLAKNGWNTVLIERDVLTSGTTWHAAGMVTQLGTTPQITKIRKNSVKFYNDLKDITGLDTSFKQTGTINIATTKSSRGLPLPKLLTMPLRNPFVFIGNKRHQIMRSCATKTLEVKCGVLQ